MVYVKDWDLKGRTGSILAIDLYDTLGTVPLNRIEAAHKHFSDSVEPVGGINLVLHHFFTAHTSVTGIVYVWFCGSPQVHLWLNRYKFAA